MIDFAKITVKAGDGGEGAGSFRRIKGKRYGKADGGDGGDGGDVYCQATRDLNTLEPYRYVKNYKAENGQRGLSNLKKGARGGDLVLRVPVGTIVRIVLTGPAAEGTPASSVSSRGGNSFVGGAPFRVTRQAVVWDLVENGQKVLIAQGGTGGRGNAKLRDEFGRRPKAGERGQVGETCQVTLELKLIADVGLIGLPNAGKSTLLASLTAARPAIADYPFTTLEPNLGVMLVSSVQRLASSNNLNANSLTAKRSLVLADIPGLIEGASQGKGLGDLFLRHIERTKILVHLIDIFHTENLAFRSGSGSVLTLREKLWRDYQTIRNELKVYSKDLTKKREIIALTKIDLVDIKRVEEILKLFKAEKKKVVAISAKTGEGIKELVRQITFLV